MIVRCSYPRIEGEANGSNFFVAFPSFLIFMHCWLGYGYEYERTQAFDVIRKKEGTFLGTVGRPLSLHVRYADFDTTVGNGLGWISWLFALGNGAVQAFNYDDDIDDEVRHEVYPIYAERVATEIISLINGQNWKRKGN